MHVSISCVPLYMVPETLIISVCLSKQKRFESGWFIIFCATMHTEILAGCSKHTQLCSCQLAVDYSRVNAWIVCRFRSMWLLAISLCICVSIRSHARMQNMHKTHTHSCTPSHTLLLISVFVLAYWCHCNNKNMHTLSAQTHIRYTHTHKHKHTKSSILRIPMFPWCAFVCMHVSFLCVPLHNIVVCKLLSIWWCWLTDILLHKWNLI